MGRRARALASVPAALALLVAQADGSSSRIRWPAPADPLHRAVLAGLEPERAESLDFHVHAHLDVFVNGRPVTVPAGIGINTKDPGVKRFPTEDGSTGYGQIDGCDTPCISPLHTHDRTGILHTESATPAPNTLGQFFTEWGVKLSRSCVGGLCPKHGVHVYVDGRRFTAPPTAIRLTDGREIAIVVGTPPKRIPKSADFSGA